MDSVYRAGKKSQESKIHIIMTGRQMYCQDLGFLNRRIMPCVISKKQATSAIIDLGPIIFSGFLAIISKVATNMAPAIPSITSITPLVFIFI